MPLTSLADVEGVAADLQSCLPWLISCCRQHAPACHVLPDADQRGEMLLSEPRSSVPGMKQGS